ncbi:MAG: AI-2E family transporter [Clostridia bacterium]|nr:AI-2E family transporter [Clostridia bacterium]
MLSPLYDAVARGCFKLFAGEKEKPRRFAKPISKGIATVVSMLVLFAVFAGLLGMVIPQMIDSISKLVVLVPEKTQQAMNWLRSVSAAFSENPTVSEWISTASNTLTQWAQDTLLPSLKGFLNGFTSGVIGFFGVLINCGLGLVLCVYLLNSKKLFAAQAKKLTYSLFKSGTANYLVDTTRYVHRTFGRFINGKLFESLLIGVFCFIGMSIFQMPYALLISAVVGLFNIVPIFGPIIAAVVGSLLLLMEDPLKALIFAVFVVVLQQIDGNILGPKILGETTGLSSFWVIFAITVGGGLFGLPGMIFGVPAFAVVYAFVNRYFERRLQKKHLSDQTEDYYELRRIDEQTGEPLYGLEEVSDVPVRVATPDEEDNTP